MYPIGKILGFQFKMLAHLEAQNCDRVKDYLLAMHANWGDRACPIDPGVVQDSVALLEANGWKLQTHPLRGNVWTDPHGNEYSSHRDGQPKSKLLL